MILQPRSLNDRIPLENLICTVCQSIFVEPVLLPCNHCFCRTCFDGVVEFNALTCPCCRRRFATWLRKAYKTKTVVNQELWTYIKVHYANELEKENLQPIAPTNTGSGRKKAKPIVNSFADFNTGDKSSQCIVNCAASTSSNAASTAGLTASLHLSQPGEIRKEYEAQLEFFAKEQEKERQNELKATSEFIKKLLEEEYKQLHPDRSSVRTLANISNETMLVANPGHPSYALKSTTNPNNLSAIASTSGVKKNAISASSSSTATATSSNSSSSSASCHNHNSAGTINSKPTGAAASFLAQSAFKSLTVRLNQGSTSSQRSILTVPPTSIHRSPDRNTNSADSLTLEMCHFKPIRTVPTTPSKKNIKTIVRTPKPRRLAKFNLEERSKSSRDLTSSTIPSSLPQSPLKSAFVSINGCRSTNRQGECTENIPSKTITKKCIVMLKRLKMHTHPNGLHRTSRRHSKCRKFESNNRTISELEKYQILIKEQQRCEKLIAQERMDYEFACKLQARTYNTAATPRTTRGQKRKFESSTVDDNIEAHNNHVPSSKSLASEPASSGASRNKTLRKNTATLKDTSLRRTTRIAKPTRRFQ